ncbi:MAG TPA: MATE family efflux transporter [Polyangia bacterium]|nr:MATE family efflux transporter [Polyangia bacterium]
MNQSLDLAIAPEPTAIAPERPESLWRLIKEAILGSHRDFTKESMGRAILLLAVPMVLEMMGESVFAVVDIFWVGKLGPDAVATVGLTESMLTVVYALAIGLSIGATAVVARRTGEKRPEAAARAAAQAIWLGLGLAALVATLGIALGPRLLVAMGAPPSTVAVGAGYTRMMLGGSVTVTLLFLLNAVFRGAGDASMSMRSLWLANAINMLLGPFLVFGWGPFPKLGVLGAAVATTIGRGTGVLFQLYTLFRGKRRVAIRWADLGIDLETLGSIVRIAWSAIAQIMIGMISWVLLIRVLASFGSVVVAGYTIAFRVVMFALLPSWGMSNAAATLVGQNLGAGHADRAEQAVWRAAFYNVVVLGVAGVAFVALAGPIVSLFTDDPAVHLWGVRCLRTVAAGFLFYAYGMVVSQSFNGAGDTRTPTLINFFCFWVWEIPLAWVLSHHTGLGPQGVFLAMTIAFCTVAVVSVALFKRGKWKTVRL